MKLDELLSQAITQNASDIHLCAGSMPVLRIDGELQFLSMPTLRVKTIESILQHILSEEDYKHFLTREEIDYSFQLPDGNIRFRVNAFYQSHGPALSLRVLNQAMPTPKGLGHPHVIEKLCHVKHGLILVTGPTGSGKSTTLAAMINHINQSMHKHIISIEDPIEYIYQSDKCLINQRQVKRDTNDFASAIRSAMREDPDIILIGEMRDLETIRYALIAAETGHLVLATLHTPSTSKAISRIVDVFDAAEKDLIRVMLADTLQAVVAQTLVQRAEGGRIAAFEIMLCNPAIRNLIRENKIPQIYSAIQSGQHMGMCTMEHSLEKLQQDGHIKPIDPEGNITF